MTPLYGQTVERIITGNASHVEPFTLVRNQMSISCNELKIIKSYKIYFWYFAEVANLKK